MTRVSTVSRVASDCSPCGATLGFGSPVFLWCSSLSDGYGVLTMLCLRNRCPGWMSRGAGGGKDTFLDVIGLGVGVEVCAECSDLCAVELNGLMSFHKPTPGGPFFEDPAAGLESLACSGKSFTVCSLDEASSAGGVDLNISLRPTLVADPCLTMTGLAITACCALSIWDSSPLSLDSSSKKDCGDTAPWWGECSSSLAAFSSSVLFTFFKPPTTGPALVTSGLFALRNFGRKFNEDPFLACGLTTVACEIARLRGSVLVLPVSD